MNERDYWLRRARKTGKENDWYTYRRLRNAATRIIRYSKATYTRSVFQENINRPKQFWDQIMKCYPTKSSKERGSKVFEINEELTSEKKTISNVFCMFFATIGRKLQNTLPALANQIWKHHEYSILDHTRNPKKLTFNFKMTSIKDIKDILMKLKRKKAPGCDDIPTSLIVDGANEIAGPLSKLINRCMEMAIFPSTEKCSKITPVYKSGERTIMDNYRPISVLPVISKVFERVVHNQLYDYLEANNMLSERQFGFRKRSSTQHAVTFFSDFIRTNMDKGLMTGAVFIDLRKAFDTVDHVRLLSKLPIYGIKSKELCWFESYLFGRKQIVSYDGALSEIQTISCGVPQGSILGPLLFTLLINDIDENLRQCEMTLYADDSVLYVVGKICDVIEEKLNNDLEQIANWFVQNNLVVNLKKTKTECVLYGTHQRTSRSKPMKVKINQTKITESDVYEYLGVKMDKNLTFSDHLEKTAKKATSRVKLLSRIRHNISPYTAEIIYKVTILPILLYCNNVFLHMAPSKKALFENIQKRALKVINGYRHSVKLEKVSSIRNKMCALEVFKSLNGVSPHAFQNYFTRINHSQRTRANTKNIVLPKVKTETGKKAFSFQGANIFNQLTEEMKTETSILRFKTLCKSFNFDF